MPRTRARKLAACNRTANRLKSAAKRKAARAACTRRYGVLQAEATIAWTHEVQALLERRREPHAE